MHSILEIIDESSDSAGPDLIALDDLKLALGITDNSEDAQLQAAITFQSKIIAEYCNRRFGRAEALETFTFDYGEAMFQREALTLSLYPIAEVFEVLHASATDADWHFDSRSGRLWLGPTWTVGAMWPGTVAVTYSGGYDLPEEAPAQLQQAVIQAISENRAASASQAGILGIRELQHGNTRIAYFTPNMTTGSPGYLSSVTMDLINPYRRMYIA
jgi:Phage gp6-like head-tail connector protein